jgi:predicted amidophosphoribosyltransferase
VAAAQAQAETIADQAREEVAQREYDVSQYTKGDELQAACPKCGAALKPKAKFCSECGAPIKTTKFCTECGAEQEGTAKFCPECGTKQ